jgi:tetrahydromethanopterin:alpha-L-glutamate ligase
MPPSASRVVRLPRRLPPDVVIFAEPRDSHAAWLKRALTRRGAGTKVIQFRHCHFDTAAPHGLVIAGFAEPPRAAIVRTIPGGSFEAVTRRLGILHALRELGARVWNDARSIERCVDKSMTSFLLARAGIPTPPTWTVETQEDAVVIAARELPLGPIVLKPLFGSQGRGLRLIHSVQELPGPEETQGVYYLQRFVGNEAGGYHDYRVLVSAGRAIATMRRRANSWVTNMKRGAKAEAVDLEPRFSALAAAAARAVGADFCGVDIIVPPGGEAQVLEVNSMPAWTGLQKVTGFSIAAVIAEDFLASVRRDQRRAG